MERKSEEGETGGERKCGRGARAGDRYEPRMRDMELKRGGTQGRKRGWTAHTLLTRQWLVVCGLRWMSGGRREEEE